MSKSILVCTDGSTYGDAAIDYGCALATPLGAQLAALHVLDSRVLEGPLMADISGWIGAQPYGHQLEQFRAILEEKGQAVIDAFDDRCSKAGVPGEGKLLTGHPSRMIIDEASRADLVILGQRGVHSDLLGAAMGSTAERVVRHSSKPCLVTPDTFREIQKIMIAYDGSAHAEHALSEALLWTKALEVELIIVTVAETDDVAKAESQAEAAVQQAERGGVHAVSLICEAKRSSHAILDAADEQGVDLVVMGAYGHSRIREMILGSTTHYVITHAESPVLLVR